VRPLAGDRPSSARMSSIDLQYASASC